MPDPDVEFECTCGSADFYTYIDETMPIQTATAMFMNMVM